MNTINLSIATLVIFALVSGILLVSYLGIKTLIQYIIDNSSYDNKVKSLKRRWEEI
jgi:type IV secretory pathway component VirB8